MLNFHYKIDDSTNETRIDPIKKVYEYKRSRFCQFLIAESTLKGKFLAIDGRVQTTEHEYMDYHEKLLQNVSRDDSKGKRALVLGAGEGITGALLSNYGYEVDAVDCDGVLIKAIQEHLSDWIVNIETPKKITTYIYDAFDFLEHVHSEENRYDVVVFDLTEPNVASEDCYSKDLIEKIKSVLKPDGVFCYQNGSMYEGSVVEPLFEDYKIEQLEESVSKIAEWKFGAIKFKGE